MGYLPEDVKMEVSLHAVQAGYFGEGDTRVRDIYRLTITRGARQESFDWGQSVVNSERVVISVTPTSGREIPVPSEMRPLPDWKILESLVPAEYRGIQRKLIRGATPSCDEILASLVFDYGTFEDFNGFCEDFGYDSDSRAAYRIFELAGENNRKLERLFSELEIEICRETLSETY